ncbi:MAG: general secretion pathway protein GspK [Stellaceae bacterium]
MAGPRRHQRGFALLLVIWVLAILAVLAAGFAASTRSETRLARNLLEAARARAWAEAGIARATAALLEPDPRARWPADGTPQRIGFDGADIVVRIQDEDGKIDLNQAPTELLAGLCAELGIDDDSCAALVDGVTARRRAAAPPEAPSFQGLRFGAPAATPDRQAAAFTTVEELRQLPALDPASFARLRPFVTVYAESEHIDPAVAPREVLLAIPGIDPREVERLLAARADAARTLAPLPALTGAGLYVAPGQLHAATIIATARSTSGGSFTQRSVIALTGQPLTPVQVQEWRQEIDEDAAE